MEMWGFLCHIKPIILHTSTNKQWLENDLHFFLLIYYRHLGPEPHLVYHNFFDNCFLYTPCWIYRFWPARDGRFKISEFRKQK